MLQEAYGSMIIATLALSGCGKPEEWLAQVDRREDKDRPKTVSMKYPFSGNFLAAVIGGDGKAHLRIEGVGCGVRPASLQSVREGDSLPAHYRLNLVFATPPDDCIDEAPHDLVVDLPTAVRSPAILDFRSLTGSCQQALMGVASFLPPQCAVIE